MVRWSILFAFAILAIGCQPPPKDEAGTRPTSAAKIPGIWTPNSHGYKDGVYQDGSSIFTSCTEYREDGTYETTQQHVGTKLSYVYTENGKWTFDSSILTMEPTKKDRKMLTGSLPNEPKVTGQVYRLEVKLLTEAKMIRRAGEEENEFLRSEKPREYTVKDLPPARRTPT